MSKHTCYAALIVAARNALDDLRAIEEGRYTAAEVSGVMIELRDALDGASPQCRCEGGDDEKA